MPALTPDIWPSLDLVLPRKQRNQWSQRHRRQRNALLQRAESPEKL
jgi:hypothetical protein